MSDSGDQEDASGRSGAQGDRCQSTRLHLWGLRAAGDGLMVPGEEELRAVVGDSIGIGAADYLFYLLRIGYIEVVPGVGIKIADTGSDHLPCPPRKKTDGHARHGAG